MDMLVDLAKRYRITCFVIWSNKTLLDFIHSNQEILTESDPYYYRIREAAQQFMDVENVMEFWVCDIDLSFRYENASQAILAELKGRRGWCICELLCITWRGKDLHGEESQCMGFVCSLIYRLWCWRMASTWSFNSTGWFVVSISVKSIEISLLYVKKYLLDLNLK